MTCPWLAVSESQKQIRARWIERRRRSTHHFHDQVATNGALLSRLLKARILQGRKKERERERGVGLGASERSLKGSSYHVVLLAVDTTVHIVESLAAQRPATGAADEAVRVIEIAHGLAGLAGALHLLAAGVTNACNEMNGDSIHASRTWLQVSGLRTKILAVLLALLDLLLQLTRQFLDLALRLRRTSRTRRSHAIRQQVLCQTCSMGEIQ